MEALREDNVAQTCDGRKSSWTLSDEEASIAPWLVEEGYEVLTKEFDRLTRKWREEKRFQCFEGWCQEVASRRLPVAKGIH